MLYVDSVQKKYGNKQVLTDVYISCKIGEIIGLLGLNGSGKSTLLQIIFRSRPADFSFVKIEKRLIQRLSDRNKLIAYLPQDGFLPNHVKVKKLISLFCDQSGAEKIRNHAILNPLLNRTCKNLSSGEKRIFEIFLIIYSNADYILIDEPFNGVAPIHKEVIKDLIRQRAKHKGFIITDHDYRNILDIVSRTILLHDGGTKEIRDMEDLKHYGYIPDIVQLNK